MLLGVLSACVGNNGNSTSETTSDNSESSENSGSENSNTGSESESESDSGDDPGEDEIKIEGNNAELIDLANKLANGVSPYYSDSSRNELIISNTQIDLGYRMTKATGDMKVSHLSTKDGHSYIKDTMDVFVRMRDGNTYFAGKAALTNSAYLNIYRYGYYYYENRLEGQTFINSIGKLNEKEITIKLNSNACHSIEVEEKIENGIRYTVTGTDPYIVLSGINYKTANYDTLEVTIKAEELTTATELYIVAGDYGGFTSTQCETIGLNDDGQTHTYTIPLSVFSGYTGTLRGLRFDINGAVGTSIEISNLKIYKADTGTSPKNLTIQRSFLTYSDKLHHVLQVSAYKETEDIQAFGISTQIDADTVSKFVIKDRNGLHFDTLEKIAWNTVEYVGFDIKDAGIFGYILPCDGSGGTIRISLSDGVYNVEQLKAPDGGKVEPSCSYDPSKPILPATPGAPVRFDPIVANNENDFFMGQRIYTDTYHTFDKFLVEAECERNPLTAENVKIDESASSAGSFKGYDPLYGFYKFTLMGTGFNQPFYKHPNKHYTVKFTVTGDEYDRKMYFMTCAATGSLECAVLLDDKQMTLPVPLEVAKNFVGDGENTIYNNADATYSEVYFPMTLSSGEAKTYTVVNLYQNWGKFPLKQLSSIQYHTPYYHLSTGVTETNCIVPFAIAGPGLPDHRAMSAPFWAGQPQHNSGGAHTFLVYTDADGAYQASETTGVKIDSYGPTYCDIAIDYISDDGKIKATYVHTEMPQTDENRAYYEMKYTVLEDVKIADFKNNFRFYYCTDNNSTGVYEKIGYLDENNEYQVVDATESEKVCYVLGDNCPYFSFFYMPEYLRNNPHAEGYTNLSMLIYDYEFIIGGEKIETKFYLRNTKNALSLSLNLDDVTLKAGDTFSINAILMPWGSQELDPPENDADRIEGKMYYDTVIGQKENGDPIYYMDKNVRDVRENSLLNLFKATANKDCEVLDSLFVPKIKTTNGKTAEFTLTGGHNNCAVRVYGFEKLTAPKIEIYDEEKSEWVEYVVSSADTPDPYGYGHYYDGYMVHYDGDGTYSYSFVTEMVNGAAKKFRMVVDGDFEGWPEIIEDDDIIENPIKEYLQPKEILTLTANATSITSAELNSDRTSISLFGRSTAKETHMTFFKNNKETPMVKGQYLVYKYRIPLGMNKLTQFEFFTTTDMTAKESIPDHGFSVSAPYDGEWHVVIIDLADMLAGKEGVFVPNENGEYAINFVRWDVLNAKISEDMYVEIAYFGLHDNIEDILALEKGVSKFVRVIDGGKDMNVDPETGEEFVPVYIDPDNEQGYTQSEIEYVTWIDYINRIKDSFSMHNKKAVVEKKSPTGMTMGNGQLVISGWAVADGGIEKYVWSADGGKTWNDVTMYNGNVLQKADDAMIKAYGELKKYTDSDGNVVIPQPTDIAASSVNSSFAGSSGICADLSDYAGQKVNVTFAAVPKANTDSLCILAHIVDVEVFVAPPIEPSETVNVALSPEAIYNKLLASTGNFTGSSVILADDKSSVRVNAKADLADQYGLVMNGNTQHSGQYLFIKYKIPTGYSTLNYFEVFTSTVNAHFKDGDNFKINGIIQDNEWHVVIVDVSKKLISSKFGMNSDGRYTAKYLRVDFFDAKAAEGMYAEFAAIGFADNLDVIYKEYCSDMKYVTVIGNSTNTIDPSTGVTYVPTYVSADSGYTVSDVEYVAWIDYINRKSSSSSAHNDKSVVEKGSPNGSTLDGTTLLAITGWAVADSGIEKYVWSADGGKTWLDVTMYNGTVLTDADDAMIKAYGDLKKYTDSDGNVVVPQPTDIAASRVNGSFAGSSGICADLSDYAGQKVNVTFAAVPKADTDSLCILLHVVGVQVPETTATAE